MELYTELAPGFSISKIITGLWQIADMERSGKQLDPLVAANHMTAYTNAGLNTFDMADHYGSSEIIAGKFKNEIIKNGQVKLFTKWVPKPGQISREDVRDAIQLSLDRMEQTSLDLLQFHAWHYPDPSWLDGLFYLHELQEEGLIKHLGVTNFDAAHLRVALASGIPLVSNQICHSLLDQRADGKMVEVCNQYDVKVIAFGVMAGGFLTSKWLGKKEPKLGELKTWSEMKYKRFIDAAGGWDPYQNLIEVVKNIAEKHHSSIANIATRLVFENPAVAGVIIGARLGESAHIHDNIKSLELNIDDEDIQKIRKAQSELTPIPGDCGDEYRKPPFLTASGDLSHHVDDIPNAFTPVTTSKTQSQIFSGTPWEEFAGYCRAVKEGNRIHVSGTTATHGEKMIGGKDAAAQTHFVIDKITAAIESLGGKLEDVVRTRIFVNDISDWEPVARAHGDRFKGINPANTLVEARLVGKGYLVEIEAEAVVN